MGGVKLSFVRCPVETRDRIYLIQNLEQFLSSFIGNHVGILSPSVRPWTGCFDVLHLLPRALPNHRRR